MDRFSGDSCVVRLTKQLADRLDSNPPPDDEGVFSCSGVVLDLRRGLVLTSGQVFSQVVKRKRPKSSQRHVKTSKLADKCVYYTSIDVPNVIIDVILQLNPSIANTYPAQHHLRVGANLVMLWKCQDFDDVLKRIVPERDGWRLMEEWAADLKVNDPKVKDPNISGQCVEPVGLSSVSKSLPTENFISWFALLKLGENPVDVGFPLRTSLSLRPVEILPALHLQRGTPTYLRTTPFGSMCPSVFLNSISTGIISNIAGPRHQLIMTDARCIPGSEGGGLYVSQTTDDKRQNSQLAGIIVTPLCWKNNEWIGLTIVCSVQSILESMFQIPEPFLKQLASLDLSSSGMNNYAHHCHPTTSMDVCTRSVVLIKVGTVWGSGVIINPHEALVMTCRHVVQRSLTSQVQVRIDYPFIQWIFADFIFTTDNKSPLDLAILRMKSGVKLTKEVCDPSGFRSPVSYSQGKPVIVIGHSLLAPEHDLLPSVSSGVMSKIVLANSKPVMLQSTCAVHSGASGGGLYCAETGRLLGIVTSNASDMCSGASFPHVNFSIPWSLISPVLQEYLRTNDLAVLKQLNAHTNQLQALWNLHEDNSTSTSPLVSKL